MTDETYTLEEVLSATDAAIKLAEDNDLDINEVVGTGADGNITKGDVQKHLDALEDEVESEPTPTKATQEDNSSETEDEVEVAEVVEDEADTDEPSTEDEVDPVREHRKMLRKRMKERKEGKLSAAVRWRRLGRR